MIKNGFEKKQRLHYFASTIILRIIWTDTTESQNRVAYKRNEITWEILRIASSKMVMPEQSKFLRKSHNQDVTFTHSIKLVTLMSIGQSDNIEKKL